MVHELFRIRTAHEDLTHVGYIEHSCMMADSVVLVRDVRILDRHYEATERTHERVQGYMLVIKTGLQQILFHILFIIIVSHNPVPLRS